MYILRDDNIINIDINIDKNKLNEVIISLNKKINSSNENKVIYERFLYLIDEIKECGFLHNGRNLLEMLSDYKLFNRYKHEAIELYNKKVMKIDSTSDEELNKFLYNLSNTTFAGLYGEYLQDDLEKTVECFEFESTNSKLQIDIHKKIYEAMEIGNKDLIFKWKKTYFSAIKNSNLIKLLNIKENNKKIIIKK